MATTPDPDPIPKQEAIAYRTNWAALLTQENLEAAFQYVEDAELRIAHSFELPTAAIPVIFAAGTTALRIYPAATSATLAPVGAEPLYKPMIRALRETADTVEFADYYALAPVSAGSSQALPPGENNAESHIQEITPERREQYRQEWTELSGEQKKDAFLNNAGLPLRFHHFDNHAATRSSEKHIQRMVDLAEANGSQTRFLLHLGYDIPQTTYGFRYQSILEMRAATGDAISFQNGSECPPWCDPPQQD